MDITVAAAPPPGTAKPGDLYIDSGSRQMWLGVDPSVDPSASLLLSDIIKLEADIAKSYSDAKAYCDTQILTRAPTVHTHTASQITDFSGAVASVVAGIPGFNWVKGMIMMWAGSLAEIGVGELAGWALCDGSQGTPNLRDRFILGAGNKVPGSTNSGASMNTSFEGQHTHTAAGTALSVAQMPSHQHPVTGSATIVGPTGVENQAHTHYSEAGGRQVMVYTGGSGGQGTSGGGMAVGGAVTSNEMQNHNHNINLSGPMSGTAAAIGSGASHTHGLSYDGTHAHVVTSAALRDTIPYFALAYIMKL